MTNQTTPNELASALDSLVIFRNLLQDAVLAPLRQLLNPGTAEPFAQYADFVSALCCAHTNLTEYVLARVLEDENFCIVRAARGLPLTDAMQESLARELHILEQLAQLKPADVQAMLGFEGALPDWDTAEIDFSAAYRERLGALGRFGYGYFAKSRMFQVRDGEAVPVKYPDTTRLSDLSGYEFERQAVIRNTLALLAGKPAQNVLLYGDAGTGKSSTVKAIVNEYADEGLRLIQLGKDQLSAIPQIVERVTEHPLKFILFLDDLSFSAEDDSFHALKASLEGSVAAHAENVVIYATSNRRHFVRERFSDRDSDDIHRNDTMEETYSLVARFGLRVNFGKPDKKSYLRIVRALAVQYGIALPEEKLFAGAEAFAIANGGRAPRTARQFIRQLCGEQSVIT